mgnify:FL=1
MRLTTLISLLADIMDKMDIADKSYGDLSKVLMYLVDENNQVSGEYVVNDDEIWIKFKK